MELVPSATESFSATVATVPVHRRHSVDGTYNLRDTGGYATPTGSTRWGKLFRSDALHQLTETSRERVSDLGIDLVVDLRDDTEVASAPSNLDGLGIEIARTPIYTSGPHLAVDGEITLASLYRVMVTEYGERLTEAVRLVATSGDGAVLVHCTAGKDRTGLVIALVLSAVGVAREDVVADYAATEENLRGVWADTMLARMVEHGYPESPELAQIVTASPPELIEEILDLIEGEHGTVAAYLQAKGLSPADLEALSLALVDTTIPQKVSMS